MSSKMAFKLVNLCRRLNSLAFADLATKKHCISFLSSKILNSYSPVQTCTFSVLSRLNIQNKASQTTKELDVPDDLYKRIVIELKGHDPEVINSYEKFAKLAANELDVNIAKISTPKRNITRYTQLKSVHIFKKHRVQYETRTHFRVLELKHLTGSTADTYLEYIQRNLPEGMAMKVTRSRLESIPKHIQEAMNETGSIEASSS